MKMKKAIIFYHSKHGTTKKYAEEIGSYLIGKGVTPQISSITDYSGQAINEADYLFIGCWTSGLFFFLQHPEKVWVEFATKLPIQFNGKVALFTTYKVATGSMFRKMRNKLTFKVSSSNELKSRNGLLSENDKACLDLFIR
jgi:flavodoxin